jgi:uncharacterized membrane protein
MLRGMSFESRLRKETPRWVAAGLVTTEQAERIEALHPEHEGAAARRFLLILTGLGAALCVVGLALIISSNWEHIHRWVKIVALLALMGGAYGGGYWLKFGPQASPRMGEALIMGGCVLFLLGIALISQIFHLGGRAGDAVLVWIAGIAAVPFLTRTRGAFFVLLLAAYSWCWIEAIANDGWLALAPEWHNEATSLPFVLLCASLVLYWLSLLWPDDWRDFAGVQQAWPVAVICAVIYAAGFTHEGWWGQQQPLHYEPALFLVMLAGVAAVLGGWRRWTEWRLLSPWILLSAAPALIAFGRFFTPDVQLAASVLSWITLLALNVFMARAGLAQGRPWLVNLAIAFIALNIFTRYFDLFSSMLNQGLMFLVSGVVVLGVGWFLERKRRALLATIKRGAAS